MENFALQKYRKIRISSSRILMGSAFLRQIKSPLTSPGLKRILLPGLPRVFDMRCSRHAMNGAICFFRIGRWSRALLHCSAHHRNELKKRSNGWRAEVIWSAVKCPMLTLSTFPICIESKISLQRSCFSWMFLRFMNCMIWICGRKKLVLNCRSNSRKPFSLL